MMMMNCFSGMVIRRKVFSLISRWDHYQRSSPSPISYTPQARLDWTCVGPELRLCWMKLCSSENHCTMAPRLLYVKSSYVFRQCSCSRTSSLASLAFRFTKILIKNVKKWSCPGLKEVGTGTLVAVRHWKIL